MPHPDSPNTCTECLARGTTCRPQQSVETWDRSGRESRQSLQRRVAELENALNSISRKLDITDSAIQPGQSATKTHHQPRPNSLPPTPASLVTSPPDNYLDNAPVLSLFDNAILSRRQDDNTFSTTTASTAPPGTSVTSARAMKLESARQTLLLSFSSQVKLEAILGAADLWWPTWQHMFPETFGTSSDCTFDHFIENTKPSENVLKLAKALICISICLQEVPFSTNCQASTATDMANRYIGMIDELVLSDDELAGTLDGIECLILQAKYDSNNGRLRRAWLGFRRGISFAQLLGCHLRSTQSNQSSEHIFRRKSIWNALYLGDRYISLLLGLPYCVSETHVHPTAFNGLYPVKDESDCAGSDYLIRLARLVGYIIDRNQTTTPTESLTMTVKIEGELIDLAATMSNEWWALDMHKDEVLSLLYYRILPQFWHHQARALLHLPFMLKATTDRRYGYNKIAALESARAMLNLFHLFRPVQGFGSPVCKLMDFQAFTAAMILVLNFLGVSSSKTDNEVQEADEDRKLVSTTTSILQHASVGAGGGVATQAARALEMFIKAKDHGSIDGQATCKVVIPYFGTVCFGPGTSFANKSHPGTQVTPPQPQVPTPEEEPLVYPNSDQTASSVDPAPIPLEFNYGGFPFQQNQRLGTDINAFATANLDLDGDWSWFWDNTEFPYGDMQSLARLPSLN